MPVCLSLSEQYSHCNVGDKQELMCQCNIWKSKLAINLFTQQLSEEILKVLGKLMSPSKKSSLKPLNWLISLNEPSCIQTIYNIVLQNSSLSSILRKACYFRLCSRRLQMKRNFQIKHSPKNQQFAGWITQSKCDNVTACVKLSLKWILVKWRWESYSWPSELRDN